MRQASSRSSVPAVEDEDSELQAALLASLETATAAVAGASGAGATDQGVLLQRGRFVAGACSILKLAVDGSEGLLHSARALRDMSLQRTRGDQDIAGRQVLLAAAAAAARIDRMCSRTRRPAAHTPRPPCRAVTRVAVAWRARSPPVKPPPA